MNAYVGACDTQDSVAAGNLALADRHAIISWLWWHHAGG